jgi:hypothetical protein
MLAVCLLLGLALPQEPPDAQTLLARYGKLDKEQRSLVVRNVERRLGRADDALLRSISDCGKPIGSYAAPTAPTAYAIEEYAPVATKRVTIPTTRPEHARATKDMRELRFLPDLVAEVWFERHTGRTVRRERELEDDERFANLANGYAPYADHAVARVLQALDNDDEQKRLAEYFGHLYADRDGKVFAGVSLFTAWHSGRQIEMPDTDGIAFARNILRTQAFVAPIPADRRRDRLYEQVRKAFAEYREHLSMRLALAGAFVHAAPPLEPGYEPLIRRAHFLWRRYDRDPAAVAAYLASKPDRSAILVEVDAALRSQSEVADAATADVADLQRFLRALVDKELSATGG